MADKVADLFGFLGLEIDESAFERGSGALEVIKGGLEAIAAYEGVKWLGELVKGVEETATGAERAAQKLGITTDAVQELNFVAKASGIEVEKLQTGMVRLARGLDEARKGSGPAAEALRGLGISQGDAAIKSGDLHQQFTRIADAFSKMPESAEKVALATKLFGRAGAELLPILNEGAAGIGELEAKAKSLGVVMDKDALESFKKLEKQSAVLSATWEGVKNTAVTALLPVIQDLVSGLGDWLAANKDLIASGLEAALDAVAFAAKAVVFVLTPLVEWIKAAADGSVLAQGAFVALGVIILSAIVPSLIAATAAAGAFVLSLAPILVPLGLIAAGILLVIKHWDALKGAFTDAFHWVVDKVEALGGAIRDAFENAFDYLRNLPVIKQIIDAIQWARSKLATGDTAAEKRINSGVATGVAGEQIHFATPNGYVPIKPDLLDDSKQRVHGAPAGDVALNVTNHYDIHGGDPAAVQEQIQEHWERQMRDLNAVTNKGLPA